MPTNLTPLQRDALTIIRDHAPIKPREFALLMWPDSEGWKTSTKCGNYGVTRGGGMNLAGGAYLGTLRKLGFVVRYKEGFELSDLGRESVAYEWKLVDEYRKNQGNK